MTQKIPYEGERVETGPVQFGDDWPGVFIRGDHCLWYANMLYCAVRMQEPGPFCLKTLESLRVLLQECRVLPGVNHGNPDAP